jgi:hypothetical protein
MQLGRNEAPVVRVVTPDPQAIDSGSNGIIIMNDVETSDEDGRTCDDDKGAMRGHGVIIGIPSGTGDRTGNLRELAPPLPDIAASWTR